MANVIQDFERYLKETLEISVTAEKWEGVRDIPFFLRDLYSFYQASLLNINCLLMAARNDEEQTPATIRKHITLVGKKCEKEVVYLNRMVTAYNRKRLIEYKVSFVIPGNQMYLPLLGIDLREHFKKLRGKRKRFSPSTQTVILHALFHDIAEPLTPTWFAQQLGYTPMTMTRAMDELESAGLGEVAIKGRERVLNLGNDKKSLWNNGRKLMRTPVRKVVYIKPPGGDWPGLKAGLTALAHYSMLAAPIRPIYALSEDDWKSIQQRGDVITLSMPEPDSFELEIWKYSPHLFAENRIVDRFSLYLSLEKTNDERVESALDEMMEGIAW